MCQPLLASVPMSAPISVSFIFPHIPHLFVQELFLLVTGQDHDGRVTLLNNCEGLIALSLALFPDLFLGGKFLAEHGRVVELAVLLEVAFQLFDGLINVAPHLVICFPILGRV